jgi:hypothetical protein
MPRPDLAALACIYTDYQHFGCLGQGMVSHFCLLAITTHYSQSTDAEVPSGVGIPLTYNGNQPVYRYLNQRLTLPPIKTLSYFTVHKTPIFETLPSPLAAGFQGVDTLLYWAQTQHLCHQPQSSSVVLRGDSHDK